MPLFGFVGWAVGGVFFFFSSRRRHTRFDCDWSSDVCSSDLIPVMRMIRMTPEELKRRAENFIRELRPELPLDEVEIEVVDGASLAGGGSTPKIGRASCRERV